MKKQRISVKRFLLASLLTVFFALVWWIPFQIGSFYSYQDQFSGNVLRGNVLAAREDIAKLEYYYGWNGVLDNFWLDGLANQYLFYNAPSYRSSLDYLTGNYTKTSKDLENNSNFWALYMKGNAKWRIAQGMYGHGLEIKDKKEAEKIKKEADDLAYSAKEEYEEAIRNDPVQSFPPKWNYDLTTDPSARLAALMPKPQVKIPLGYPNPQGVPSGPEPIVPGKGSEDLDEKKGLPNPKRGG